MELPLTEPCPQCGADMEPRKTARGGRMIYECPECGYQMEITEPRPDGMDQEPADHIDLGTEDDEARHEERGDNDKVSEI